jgi:cytoskeletal protein RodZ
MMRHLLLIVCVILGIIGASWWLSLQSADRQPADSLAVPAAGGDGSQSPGKNIPSAGTVRSTSVVADPANAPPSTAPDPAAPPREVPWGAGQPPTERRD